MAIELRHYIREQLAKLPANHPDRHLLEGMLGTTQAYIDKSTPGTKPNEEFQPRLDSRTDLYLQEMGIIERFSQNARTALYHATDAAARFNHNYIGTEHILLGILNEDNNATKVLAGLSVKKYIVKSAVEFIIGRVNKNVPFSADFTPSGKKVIELAIDESRRLNKPNIDSQELLLGLIREREGIAARVLESLGVDSRGARLEVQKMFPYPKAS